LDENIGLRVYDELRRRGINAESVILEIRGAHDIDVVEYARVHGKIIVTMDKDFGYLAQTYEPPGIILLRLRDPRIPNRLQAILKVIERYGVKLYGYITVVSEYTIRRRPIKP